MLIVLHDAQVFVNYVNTLVRNNHSFRISTGAAGERVPSDINDFFIISELKAILSILVNLEIVFAVLLLRPVF